MFLLNAFLPVLLRRFHGTKWPPELKIETRHALQRSVEGGGGASFPAGASQDLLSPCWHFTGSSFPAGASHGLLSQLVINKVPILKFCHGNQNGHL